jgi:hypothetical protein
MKATWLALYAIAGIGSWSCASAQLSPQPEQAQDWPPGPCEFSEADPYAAAQKCKQRVDAGDAAAMYQFSTILLTFAPDPIRSPRAEVEKWKPLGDKYSWAQWLDLAAKKGNQTAIRVKCEMGKDPLAPAERRNEGPKWCARVVKSPDDEVAAELPEDPVRR